MTMSYHVQQLRLGIFEPAESVHHFAEVESEGRGAVFTRREVVEFMLDLTGYAVDRPLHRLRLLELSFGEGGFSMTCPERYLGGVPASFVKNQNLSAFDFFRMIIRKADRGKSTVARRGGAQAGAAGKFLSCLTPRT